MARLNFVSKLVVFAVLITVVVILIAPTVDLPDSVEVRGGITKAIVAPAVILVAAVSAALSVPAPAVREWDIFAVSPRSLALEVIDLCCVRLC